MFFCIFVHKYRCEKWITYLKRKKKCQKLSPNICCGKIVCFCVYLSLYSFKCFLYLQWLSEFSNPAAACAAGSLCVTSLNCGRTSQYLQMSPAIIVHIAVHAQLYYPVSVFLQSWGCWSPWCDSHQQSLSRQRPERIFQKMLPFSEWANITKTKKKKERKKPLKI